MGTTPTRETARAPTPEVRPRGKYGAIGSTLRGWPNRKASVILSERPFYFGSFGKYAYVGCAILYRIYDWRRLPLSI